VFHFTLNLALSQSLLYKRNSSIVPFKTRAPHHVLPADAKRVDTGFGKD